MQIRHLYQMVDCSAARQVHFENPLTIVQPTVSMLGIAQRHYRDKPGIAPGGAWFTLDALPGLHPGVDSSAEGAY